MNCDCIEETRAKLVEHFKPQAGENVQAECDGLGINFRTGGMSLTIPYTIRGTASKFKSIKGFRAVMVASFCPFCGKSTEAATQSGKADTAGGGK